jgi:hypothetical protein
MTRNPTQRTGLIIFSLFTAFAIALVVLIAIERNVIWPLIIGFVIVAVAVITASAAMVNKVAVPFMAARLKFMDVQLAHERSMLELKLKYNPPALPAARATADRTWKPELEKWRMAAIELVALTIDTPEYGRDSTKIISANRAQANELFKSAGRVQNALDFLTGNGLVYVIMAGGKQEGTAIQDSLTAGELMAILSPARLRGSK